MVPPVQGALLPATGMGGVLSTVTEVVPAGPTHPDTVAITVYVPSCAVDKPGIVGFCNEEVKLFGPVHE
jgi:hypothetical protein